MLQKFIVLLSGLMLVISLSACGESTPVNCIDGFHEEDGKCVEDDPVCYAPSDYSDQLTYELVFEDEFDGTEVNEDIWNFELFGGGGNNEIVLYTEDNHTVADGFLTITARQEQVNDWEYTSTRMTTKGNAQWKYGIIEVRAMLPDALGTWPAIWMLPGQNNYGIWPNSGEIDIMEHVGYDLNTIHGTIHTRIYNHKDGSQKGGSIDDYTDVTTAFHTYSIEWLPDRIIFQMDGEDYYTYNATKFSSCPTYNVWPFNEEFYLILNVAVGGDWGGANGVDPNDYPTDMVIDYVRVYQATELIGYDDHTD